MNGFSSRQSHGSGVVVAIPVHNEAAVIEGCLSGFAAQNSRGPFEVVVLLNNCTDATSNIVHRMMPTLPFALHILEYSLDPALCTAGVARRLAMQHAAKIAGPDGTLLTTDADTVVPGNWIAANLAHLSAGADAVAGMAEIDPADAAALPRKLLVDEAKCDLFRTLLDEIDWLLDPDEVDCWPRHTQHSGASIAVRAAWHARAGGIPPTPLAEDRKFFAELRRLDARIRHAPDIVVTVSGRTQGRAKGGMADTISRRMRQPDKWLDECFEPAPHRVRRARLRARARRAWKLDALGEAVPIAFALGVPACVVRRALTAATFGSGWSELERASPILRHTAVRSSHLAEETATGMRIVQQIRAGVRANETERRGDSARFAAAL
jgi:hypothetical protein